jgi:hypothetical protein
MTSCRVSGIKLNDRLTCESAIAGRVSNQNEQGDITSSVSDKSRRTIMRTAVSKAEMRGSRRLPIRGQGGFPIEASAK